MCTFPFSSPSCHVSRGGSRTRHGPLDLCCQGQTPRAVSSNADTFQWVRLEKQWNIPCVFANMHTVLVCVCVCGRTQGPCLERSRSAVSVAPFDRGHVMSVVRCLRHRAVSCLPFDTSPWTAWTSWVRTSLFDCLRAFRSWVRFPKSTGILKATATV